MYFVSRNNCSFSGRSILNMYGALILTLMGLLIVVCPNQTNGALTFFPGPCPDNHKPGDVWHLTECRAETCHADGYTQETCGVVDIHYDPTTCYIYYDRTANYPNCCLPKLLCIGDAGFYPGNLVG